LVSPELRSANFLQIIVTLLFLAASDDSAATADTHIVRIANARTVLIVPSAEASDEPLATAPRTVAIELAAPANASYRSVDVYIFLIESLRRYGWRNISSAWLAVTYRRRPGSGCGFSRGQYRRCNRRQNCSKAEQLGSSHRATSQGRCAQALRIRRLSLASRYSWSAEYFRVYFRGRPLCKGCLGAMRDPFQLNWRASHFRCWHVCDMPTDPDKVR
jgi:hypothetical protein